MSIAIVACKCGSTDSLARNFLQSIGYDEWLDIPIYKGRNESLSFLHQLPATQEREMLANFLKDACKWLVVIGYDRTSMKWSDIAHNAPKSIVEAEFVAKRFM